MNLKFLPVKKFRQSFVLIALIFLFCVTKGQYQTQARIWIDSLASSHFNGRGYSDSADHKVATFIANEFANDSLKKFATDYFQHFLINVNTFPGKLSLTVNGKQLTTGVDFIAQPKSYSTVGEMKVIHITHKKSGNIKYLKKLLTKNLDHYVLVWDKDEFDTTYHDMFIYTLMKYPPPFPPSAIIEFTNEKLTADMSETQSGLSYFTVNNGMHASEIKSVSIQLNNRLLTNYQTQNVVGYVEGKIHPDSFLVFTAHYDHLGQMGDGTFFPGANDNASGTSMLMTLAKYFSQHQPDYSICFIAFSGEELGLLGSKYYTEHPMFPLSQIKFLINMDIVGTGDDGIKVVNGSVLTNEFEKLVALNDSLHLLKSVQPRGKAANSDHYFFTEKNVPSFFIYTLGGISAYHDVFDKAETLPLTEFDDLTHLLIEFCGEEQ